MKPATTLALDTARSDIAPLQPDEHRSISDAAKIGPTGTESSHPPTTPHTSFIPGTRASARASSPDSQPTLPPDTQSQILDLFIAGQMELSAIAALCGITFAQLLDFLESPRILARLDAIQRLCERRAALLAAEARCLALARLRTIAEHQPETGYTPAKLFTRELETTRKAAAQLLRLHVPPPCPQVGAQDSPTAPRPPRAPCTPVSRPRPRTRTLHDLIAHRAAKLGASHLRAGPHPSPLGQRVAFILLPLGEKVAGRAAPRRMRGR